MPFSEIWLLLLPALVFFIDLREIFSKRLGQRRMKTHKDRKEKTQVLLAIITGPAGVLLTRIDSFVSSDNSYSFYLCERKSMYTSSYISSILVFDKSASDFSGVKPSL